MVFFFLTALLFLAVFFIVVTFWGLPSAVILIILVGLIHSFYLHLLFTSLEPTSFFFCLEIVEIFVVLIVCVYQIIHLIVGIASFIFTSILSMFIFIFAVLFLFIPVITFRQFSLFLIFRIVFLFASLLWMSLFFNLIIVIIKIITILGVSFVVLAFLFLEVYWALNSVVWMLFFFGIVIIIIFHTFVSFI